MGADLAVSDEFIAAAPPPLGENDVHVFRVRTDRAYDDASWAVLSGDERERAQRFHFERDRRTFVLSHAALRRELARLVEVEPQELRFTQGEFGKPALAGHDVHFNLSHSGAIALFATSRRGAVGIDVEQWDEAVEHLSLAEHFFSEAERVALRQLAHDDARTVAGFFAAWSRKEAYLKASGHGITRGLHHFDVSLVPGEPARLIADALDAEARERWIMRAIDAGEGYSAALVAESPVDDVLFFDVG